MNVFKNMFVFITQSKAILVALLLFFYNDYFSQINLIPNPSFENYDTIPNNGSQIRFCQNWVGTSISPDYYSSLSPTIVTVPRNWAGYQNPKHGGLYIGVFCKVRGLDTVGYPPFANLYESVQCQLPLTLQKDHIYDFSLYYSLADGVGIASNQLQAYFSSSSFTPCLSQNYFYDSQCFHDNLSFQVSQDTSQFMIDTMNWQRINGCFIAAGIEKFLSIGNFRSGIITKYKKVIRNISFNSNPELIYGSYYFIDDLSLYDRGYYSGKVQCRNDTTICLSSTITLGNNIKDSALVVWSPNVALSCTNCPNPNATPSLTTKYYVTKNLCSFVTKDSITVTVHTPTLNANAGSFKSICLSDTVKLGINDTTAYTSYTWQPVTGLSCTNCPQPVTTPFASTTYTLTKKECSFTTSDTVSIYVDACEVIIPDIFTPNNDNVNDEWKIKLPTGFKLKAVSLYNRWGTLIYTIDDTVLNSEKSKVRVINWDGRTTSGIECSEGVYFYVIHFTDKNVELKKLKGNVTLMR